MRKSFVAALAAIGLVTLLGTAPEPVTAQSQEEGAQPRGRLLERLRERRAQRAGSSQPAAASNKPIDGPGDYEFTLQHDGLTREYRVHVPPGYSSSRPTPLLFSFHGGGGNMEYQSDDSFYGQISASNRVGFIAVFPNGVGPRGGRKLATFNAGICCGGARDRNVDDVGFVRAILERLTGQLNIDRSRIFATGISNGGMMSYRLACEMSDTFKAIASVAGTDGMKDTCTPKNPVSILHFHARDDDMVLFKGGAGKESKTLANFVSVEDSIAKWVRFNSCSPTPRRVLEKPGAYCDVYTQCRGNNVEVKLCVTDTGGHSWPGGVKVRTKEPGSRAINANDIMWDFFLSR